jgi:hypothetical protein
MRRTVTALAALAGLCGLPACGDDDDKDKKPETVRISISDEAGGRFKITAPTSVPAGTAQIEFRNNGKVDHEAQLIRVDGNHSQQEVLTVLGREGGPIPSWLHGGGGVAPIKPGQTLNVVQRLQPGTYYVLDLEGPDQPENAPPNATKGAAATIQVRDDGGSTAALPRTEARVTAVEYGFRPTGLHTGLNRVEFDNAGREPHHLIALPINQGRTINDVRRALQSEGPPQGPPPVDEENATGTAVLDGGTKQVALLNIAKPGKYALVCFISDRAGGPPHVAKGMVNEATVD